MKDNLRQTKYLLNSISQKSRDISRAGLSGMPARRLQNSARTQRTKKTSLADVLKQAAAKQTQRHHST